MPPNKKGFRPKPKATATLKFTDGDYEGAEVVCALRGSMGLYLDMLASTGETAVQAALLERFGNEVLISWNLLGSNDQPLPADGFGMLAVDADFAQSVVSAWIDASVGVPAPLDGESSSGGEALPERSIPMETLSGSPAN